MQNRIHEKSVSPSSLMTKSLQKLEAAVRSLHDTKNSVLGLSGLFQNVNDNMGMTTDELQGVGTLLRILSDRLATDIEAIELAK